MHHNIVIFYLFTEIVVLIWMTLCTSFLTFLSSILLITGVFKVKALESINVCTANDDILEGQKLSVGLPAFPNHSLECRVNGLFGPGFLEDI